MEWREWWSTRGPSPPFHFLIVSLSSFVVFANSLHGQFVFDDHQAILSNEYVTEGGGLWSLATHDFWGTPLDHPGSHGSWRPLTTLTFRLNYLMGGRTTWGYHVVNVLLHTMCSCLVLRMGDRVVERRGPRLVAAILFALHSVHCEAVASIVGRADVLAGVAVLGGLAIDPMGDRLWLVFSLSALGFLCKETAVCLLPLWILRGLAARRKVRWILPRLGVFLVLVLLRLSFSSFPSFSASDNPAARHSSVITRTLTFLYLPVLHLRLLLWPDTLCFDWSMGAVPLVYSPLDGRFLRALLVYAGMAWLLLTGMRQWLRGRATKEAIDNNGNVVKERRGEKSGLLFSLGLLVVPHVLVSSNLFAYVGFVVAERVLYIPSAGFCLLVAVALDHASARLKWNLLPLLVLSSTALAVMATRTVGRNEDWKDELRLYSSAVDINPAKAWANLGEVLLRRGRSSEAESAFLSALSHRPSMADTHYNLGLLYSQTGNFSMAIDHYREAIAIRSSHAPGESHLNLALALASLGRSSDAMDVYEKCASLDISRSKTPSSQRRAKSGCAINGASLLLGQSSFFRALSLLHVALGLADGSSLCSVWTLTGEAEAAMGREERAEEAFDRALLCNPHHTSALLTAAQWRIRQNRSSEAWTLLRRAASASPSSALVHLHLGMAYGREGSRHMARDELSKALHLDPQQAEALAFLASIERDEGRGQEAEKLLRRLVAFHPSASSLALLGAQLHSNKKYDEALSLYDESLRLVHDHMTEENRRKLIRILSSRRG